MKAVLACRSSYRRPGSSSAAKRSLVALTLSVLLTGCGQQLLGSLDEPTANQVVSTLRQEGIRADKVSSGETQWRVTVADEQFAEAVQALDRHNLPARSFQGLGQVFKKDSLVSTPTEERARLIHAMSQELERSLTAVDGILLARVHPVILPSDPLNPKQRTATASVLVKYRAGSDVQNRESMIRSLVAAGVEGLTYDDVRVVMVPSAPTSNWPTMPPAAHGMWREQAPLYGLLVVSCLALITSFGWWRKSRSVRRLSGRWSNTLDTVMGHLSEPAGGHPSRTRKTP